ncbi:MAG: type II secretion system protein [Planctomycetota bacterium]|jgi:prepilin-type N-terminal cleavage/methylation domain-containing protein
MVSLRRHAFSLLELLVVAAIIALLISIVLPSLTKARQQTRLTVCKSHLRQLGTGIASYTHSDGVIPHGPDVQPLGPLLQGNDGTTATSQIWTGPQEPMTHLMAHGLLITKELAYPSIIYYPGDDSNDPVEELEKVVKKKMEPAYSSYLYRQLDETNKMGRLEKLGKNSTGGRATALAMDVNSLIASIPGYLRTNHKARKVNILYFDSSVRSVLNDNNRFALKDEHLMDMPGRLKKIFQKADADY